MTLVPPAASGDGDRRSHPGELRLRRHRIGELGAGETEEVSAHLAGCADCRIRFDALEDEQRAFATQISFERFAGGVERAARVPRVRPMPRRAVLAGGGIALAAAAALVLVLRPTGGGDSLSGNRIKGGELAARIQIASADGSQRALEPGDRTSLRPGDRLRLGYQTARPRHLVALSIDDTGATTVLYPDQGDTLPVAAAPALSFLPGSIELTGGGRERIYLITGERPFGVEAALRAVGAEHDRAGRDVTAFGPLHLGAGFEVVTFTWLFEKP